MYLKNNCIQLRAIEPEDVDFLYNIENNTANWETGSVHLPLSRATLLAYLQQPPVDVFMATDLKWMITLRDGTPLGMLDINNIDHFHKRAEVGIFIDAAFRKQTYAFQALTLLAAYAKNYVGWHQLTAVVAQKNTASHRLFQKMGFVQSGVLKDYFKTVDDFEDASVYQLVL
jgi:diamine N-acetyltransferase